MLCFSSPACCLPCACSRRAEEEALAALAAFPGVKVINDRAANRFPTPLDASNMDDVYVGRWVSFPGGSWASPRLTAALLALVRRLV